MLCATPLLHLHEGDVLCLAQGGRTVALGSWGETVLLLDADTLRCTGELYGGPHGRLQQDEVRALVEERRFISAPPGPTVLERMVSIQHLVLSKDGAMLVALASGYQRAVLLVFDLPARRLLRRIEQPLPHVYDHQPTLMTVLGLAASGGTLLAVVQPFRGQPAILRWDLRSGRPLPPVEMTDLAGVMSVAFSPDGRRAAASSTGGKLTLWSMDSGQRIGQLDNGTGTEAWQLRFSPDGRLLGWVSGSTNLTETVVIMDLEQGRLLAGPLRARRVLAAPNSGGGLAKNSATVWDIAFSPDGRRAALAHGHEGGISLWDLAGPELLLRILPGHLNPIDHVEFGAEGSLLHSIDYRLALVSFTLAQRPTVARSEGGGEDVAS